MRLWTDAVDREGYFDSRYTCDIDNSSPELRWDEPPAGSVAFALIAEDPDSSKGSFAHWVVYGIPAEIDHLPAGIPPMDTLPNGIRQGVNGFNKLGYSGPCPPRGARSHRYYFRLHALSRIPEISNRATRGEVLAAIQPHILETAEISGLYQRSLEKAG